MISSNDCKKNEKQYINILKINLTGEARIEFRLRKSDETTGYLSDEIKNNDLMSEKYKKTCKYLNYIENLLILSSTITGCL